MELDLNEQMIVTTDTFPNWVRTIDNDLMAKWFIVVMRYTFENNYHDRDDYCTAIDIEFAKLTNINEDCEYINFFADQSDLISELSDIVMESMQTYTDPETQEKFEQSWYLGHFFEIIEFHFDDIRKYFSDFLEEGYTNATFAKSVDRTIVWVGPAAK